MAGNIKIIYDISVLGYAHFIHQSRTGVYRVVEHTALGLAQSGECETVFCASQGNYLQCMEYLRSSVLLSDYGKVCPPYKFLPIIGNLFDHIPFGSTKSTIYNITDILLNKILSSKVVYTDNPADYLKKNDIYHSSFYPIPPTTDYNKIKVFQTVYDLIGILFPKYFQFNKDNLIYRILDAIKPDTFVLCISEATRNDLLNYLKIADKTRVFVVPLAASDNFYHCTDRAKIASVRNKYNIPTDSLYVLSVSTLEPRKNIASTIKAFVRILQEENINDLYLVLTGTKGWDYDRIFSEIENSPAYKDKIILTNYVPDEDLAPLYSGALAFVYPSFYEGFGLPTLEAMQCGTPVITSNTSSLPEVVGDAGIMIDPTDLDALCQAMLHVYLKPEVRKNMSIKSLSRAGHFSWEKYTQDVINAYKTALG